jgi:prolyl-tRNA editing enzyme YbaK/EbsC (Cys-tRNA(Pro) deacylase)
MENNSYQNQGYVGNDSFNGAVSDFHYHFPLGLRKLQEYISRYNIAARIITDEKEIEQIEAGGRTIKSMLLSKSITRESILAILRCDTNIDYGKLGTVLGCHKKDISPAPSETVEPLTGYQVGGVPPVGLNLGLCIILDQRVLEFSSGFVYGGGGCSEALLEISPADIPRFTQAQISDISRPRPPRA